MTALYVIANEYRAAAEKLAELDLDAQTIADTLESLSGDLEQKAQNVAFVVRNLEVTAQAIKAFEDQQRERRKAIENRADGLRDYLQRCMEATGIERIEGPGILLSFRKSSAVVIDGVDLIPAEFMRAPEPKPAEPDKTAIAAALKAGTEVPGAHIEKRRLLQIK
jgi:hypothetical protein